MGTPLLLLQGRHSLLHPLPSTSFSVKMANQSQIRQNYHEECEALVNKQANMQLYTSYVYLSMSAYFHRDDLALPGFADFFRRVSEQERLHGATLMRYQTMRGGRVALQDITKPTPVEWGTPVQAMVTVLDLERKVNQSLLELQTAAMAKADFHLAHFIQETFLNTHVNRIKLVGDLVSQIKRAGDGLGIHVVDNDISVICKKWAYIMDNNTFKVVRNGKTRETFVAQRDDANNVRKEDFLETFTLDKYLA